LNKDTKSAWNGKDDCMCENWVLRMNFLPAFCSDLAFAVKEVNLVNVIANEKGEEIELLPPDFMSLPAYNFPPSFSINTPVSQLYFPQYVSITDFNIST